MLLENEMLHNRKGHNQSRNNSCVQKDTKHFSPTAALTQH